MVPTLPAIRRYCTIVSQPGGAGTKGSLSPPLGWDAVVSGLRPEPHVLRAENLRVNRRFRRVVLQSNAVATQTIKPRFAFF
jgi:hypothetical protein